MVDFTQLLRKPAGEAKKPPAFPPGNCPGIIKGYEFGDKNKNKTPYVRLALQPTGFPDGTDQEVARGIDLSKRQLRKDFYITDDALWRFDEFLASCGIELKGREYPEVIPELIGKSVIMEVVNQLNEATNETFSNVNAVKGEG